MSINAHIAATEDGSVPINIRNARHHIKATLIAWGEFAGGTVMVEAKPKMADVWIRLSNGLMEDGFETMVLPPELDYRVTLIGADPKEAMVYSMMAVE
jgi:hypothetical protein